jgi:L-asparaginase
MLCSPLVTYAAESLPLVKILSTGGTISAKYDKKQGGFKAALSGQEIIDAVPRLQAIARIEVEEIFRIGSSDVTPEHWVKLLKRVNQLLFDPSIAGIVITHGTDTLEETSYFLDLTVTSQKPVVCTAAMKAATEKDADGPRNVLNAVRVAISPESSGKGVLVVLNGQIHAARNVTKTNSVTIETFQTPEFGQLGVVDYDGQVRFYRAPLRRQTIPLGDDPKLPQVEIILCYAGADGRVIRGLLTQGTLDGLVIAGTGNGHISEAMEKTLKEVIDKGIPIVMSSRTGSGRIVSYYAGNRRQDKMGIVQADNLNPAKARVLLILALTKTKQPAELQKYFHY